LGKRSAEKISIQVRKKYGERTEATATGSFNFTKAAEEKNAENLLVIRDKDLPAKYIENWKVHAEHSEAYLGRARKSK